MSRERDVIKVQVWRLVLLWVVMLGLFGVMVSRLWSLQIAQTMEFQRRLQTKFAQCSLAGHSRADL